MRAIWSDTREVIPDVRVRAEGIHFQKVDTAEDVYGPFMKGLDYPKYHESVLSPEVPNFEARKEKVLHEHRHEQPEVRFCLEGAAVFEVRSTDDRFMHCTVEPGDLLIIPAHRYHRFFLTDTPYIRHLLFSKSRGADGQVVPEYRNGGPKGEAKAAKSRYEEYTRYDELLALLPAPEKRVTPDELLFIVPHLTTALWLEVLLDDVSRAVQLIDEDRVLEAGDLFARAAAVEKLLTAEIEIGEKIPPSEFAEMRYNSYSGNGGDSPGFRRLIGLGDVIRPPLERLWARRGVEPAAILREPAKYYDLHLLLRGIYELDGSVRAWRYMHHRLSERHLGPGSVSRRGRPVGALLEGAQSSLVPELWGAITRFTSTVNDEAERARASGCPFHVAPKEEIHGVR